MILHVMILDKFLPPFIDFVDKSFGRDNHKYVFITSEKYLYGLTPQHNVEFLYTDEDIFVTLLSYMKEAYKIILHGLWRDKVDQLLVCEPLLLEKSYWVMWGGDFYFPESQSENRHFVIKHVKGLLTYIPKDIEYIRDLYGARGTGYQCIMYSSNVFQSEYSTCLNLKLESSRKNFILGNSASDSNNHFEIINKLSELPLDDCDFYAPLSYGDVEYAKKVISYGHNKLGERFRPITAFMTANEYQGLLNGFDVGVFNHNRQQAMGVTIQLLGYGKKLYLKKNTSQWFYFLRNGIKVYDFNDISAEHIYVNESSANQSIIMNIHSLANLKKQWGEVFNE